MPPFQDEVLIDDQRLVDLVLGLSMLGEVTLQDGNPTKVAVHQHVLAFMPSAESVLYIMIRCYLDPGPNFTGDAGLHFCF